MSTWDDVLSQIGTELKPLIEEFVSSSIAEAKPNIQAYAVETAKEAARQIIALAGKDDAEAKANLKHLKGTLQNCALMVQLQLQNDTIDALTNGLGIVLRIVLSTLKVALK